jgi:conserved oligomeric Golgi complex subunit 2
MAHISLTSPTRPTSSYSSTFNLISSSSSSAGDDDDAPLPFPAALPRSDFLAPDFHAANYLSDLPHRHQTLEDLRSELRDRSAAISAELLELVNANYTAFLSLGNELRGGDEKVEDVRVAMLGFRRAVDEVKGKVRTRGKEVQLLSDELGQVRREIETGRQMIELDERLSALEDRLTLGNAVHKKDGQEDGWNANNSDEEDEEEGDDADGLLGSSPAKLTTLAREYGLIDRLAQQIGVDTPFVVKMESRMIRCRKTILLDLGTAMKEARKGGQPGKARVVIYLATYAALGAEAEAIAVLKSK